MNSEFSKSAKDYKTYTDLTEQERIGLDTLGEILPELLQAPADNEGQSLSTVFEELCGKSSGRLGWETGMERLSVNLYTPVEDNGLQRIPRLTYGYSAVFSSPGDEDLQIVFMPAYLSAFDTDAQNDYEFVPQIVKAPEDINTIHNDNARNVLNYALTYQEARMALRNAADKKGPTPPAP